jgi:hypothetical protein
LLQQALQASLSWQLGKAVMAQTLALYAAQSHRLVEAVAAAVCRLQIQLVLLPALATLLLLTLPHHRLHHLA